MSDEREFQRHKRDYLDATRELGISLSEGEVENALRRTQARAQEHEVSMGEIGKENLRRMLREPLEGDDD